MSNVITTPKTEKIKIINREHWLTECADAVMPIIKEVSGKDKVPAYRISVGFPSRNALSLKRRTIGQCWNGMCSSDKSHQIFIHPQLVKPMEVTATVAHELVHAFYPDDGHKKNFPTVAKGIGLTGKMTATVAGEEFIKKADPIISKLGPYPHVELVANSKHKSQATRLVKCECPDCGYIIRTTEKWLALYGTVFCPCKGVSGLAQMVEA